MSFYIQDVNFKTFHLKYLEISDVWNIPEIRKKTFEMDNFLSEKRFGRFLPLPP